MLETQKFTVLSEASESSTRTWANEYNQFIGSLSALFKIDEHLLPKVMIVIFSDEEHIRPYLQNRPNNKQLIFPGFCARDDIWPFLVMTAQWETETTRQGILHEATHWIIGAAQRNFPVWADEGVAELFSTFSVSDNHATWGEILPRHVVALNRQGLMPLEDLLSTSYSSRVFSDKSRRGLFYAESWALVHYLVFGDRAERGTLDELITASQKGAPTKETFGKVFGIDYDTMESRIRAYLRQGRYRTASSSVPLSAKISEPIIPAPPAAVEAALAKLATLSGHSRRARKHAEDAVRLDPTYPSGYVSLAWICLKEGKLEPAIEGAEKAIQLGTQDAGVFWLLAEARYRKAKAQVDIASSEARQISNLLIGAIYRCSPIKRAYVSLADVLTCVQTGDLTEEDDHVLQQGQNLYPSEPTIQIARIHLARMSGNEKKAFEILELVTVNCQTLTAEQCEQVAKLRSLLEADRVSTHPGNTN